MREMSIKLWLENLKGTDHSENLDVDGEDIKWILRT
jgi:hypothetical protein